MIRLLVKTYVHQKTFRSTHVFIISKERIGFVRIRTFCYSKNVRQTWEIFCLDLHDLDGIVNLSRSGDDIEVSHIEFIQRPTHDPGMIRTSPSRSWHDHSWKYNRVSRNPLAIDNEKEVLAWNTHNIPGE